LWTIDVNDILEANLVSLKKIYERYFTSVKKHLILDDVISIFSPLEIPEKDLTFCFAMSKMTVTNEALNYK
jgi:hypothetical protein